MEPTNAATPPPLFPWQEGRACQADRAMGLELELIELVRARSLALGAGRSVETHDREIGQVHRDLADLLAISSREGVRG
ncbi:hypothetical protein [Aquihabitans sp. McL0605]|uniref:hypothetical protein n=1 Tax=Aquihabitans sp. McL0605 TaxID=3415671 RepID=UPI003CE8B035